MSGWVVPQQTAGIQLPQGIAVAGMGRRVGAWLLDSFFAGLLSFVPVLVIILAGAVRLNQQAIDQIDASPGGLHPFANVTAPIFNVDTGLLVLAAVVWVGVQAAYFIGSWVMFAGAPAQRMLSLQVADLETGKNLSLFQATLRWLVLYGVSGIIGAFVLILFLQEIATTPTNAWLDRGAFFSGGNSFGSVSATSSIVSWGSTLWSIVLLISAGTNQDRRGLHDKLAGSLVVGEAPRVQSGAVWGYPPVAPYWPPQGGPGGPAYPHPSPPQGSQYPPQGGPAYPGAGAPPGYLYPPQATPPAAPPDQQPPVPEDRQPNQ